MGENKPGVNASSASKDQYPVGDLLNKFGNITTNSNFLDATLDVWGPNSVMGHILALTWDGKVKACANIKVSGGDGGHLVEAKANFTGDVKGYIKLVSIALSCLHLFSIIQNCVLSLKNRISRKKMFQINKQGK